MPEEVYVFKEDKTKKKITISDSEPTSQDGEDGDMWIVFVE